MDTKHDIVRDWLPRYTGTPLEEFQPFILLTNFIDYVERFSKVFNVPIRGLDKPMQTASCVDEKLTIINFGIGSANAATVMDLLSAVTPTAALFLGKCGGLKKKTAVGHYIIPIAAMRGEGTSDDYFDDKVPALPSFAIQQAVGQVISESGKDYWTGTVYTTNRRVWEHDEKFKEYLHSVRAAGIDMETATIFMVGFANDISKGALLLVTDQPMVPEGIKTEMGDRKVSAQFASEHLELGIASMRRIRDIGLPVKHHKF